MRKSNVPYKVEVLTKKDISGVVKLWNEILGKYFPMNEKFFNERVFFDPNYRQSDGYIVKNKTGLVGFLVAKFARETEILEPIGRINSFFFKKEEAAELLWEKALEHYRKLGVHSITYGVDPFYFFPGVPVEHTSLIEFLVKKGFRKKGVSEDVIRDVSNFVPYHKLPEGFSIRQGRLGESERIIKYLSQEFGLGWVYSTKYFFRRGGSPQDFLLLFSGDKIVGFCHLHWNNNQVFWADTLSIKVGGIGPMGISKELRGKGLGTALLQEAMVTLKNTGVQKIIADWAVTPFYAKIGFKVWKKYLKMEKTLK